MAGLPVATRPLVHFSDDRQDAGRLHVKGSRMSQVLRRLGGTWAVLVGSALWATSAQAADAKCMLKHRSAHVAVVICPAATGRAALQAAGISACKGLEPCNAWIWDDATQAPATAPDKDTDMPKSVTGKARAVWVNDAENLIEVRKLR